MADLVFAFGLGVFAASTPLARHLAWSLLPIVGAITVVTRSTCKRITRTVVQTTTSLEPSTPAVLPKLKRPEVKVIKHEAIVTSPSVVQEQVKSNLNLTSGPITEVVHKETLESNDIFQTCSDRFTTSAPVQRPTGIAEDLIHQTDDAPLEEDLEKPDAVSLDILVQRKNFGDASYEDILPDDQNDARSARPWTSENEQAGDADDERTSS